MYLLCTLDQYNALFDPLSRKCIYNNGQSWFYLSFCCVFNIDLCELFEDRKRCHVKDNQRWFNVQFFLKWANLISMPPQGIGKRSAIKCIWHLFAIFKLQTIKSMLKYKTYGVQFTEPIKIVVMKRLLCNANFFQKMASQVLTVNIHVDNSGSNMNQNDSCSCVPKIQNKNGFFSFVFLWAYQSFPNHSVFLLTPAMSPWGNLKVGRLSRSKTWQSMHRTKKKKTAPNAHRNILYWYDTPSPSPVACNEMTPNSRNAWYRMWAPRCFVSCFWSGFCSISGIST